MGRAPKVDAAQLEDLCLVKFAVAALVLLHVFEAVEHKVSAKLDEGRNELHMAEQLVWESKLPERLRHDTNLCNEVLERGRVAAGPRARVQGQELAAKGEPPLLAAVLFHVEGLELLQDGDNLSGGAEVGKGVAGAAADSSRQQQKAAKSMQGCSSEPGRT